MNVMSNRKNRSKNSLMVDYVLIIGVFTLFLFGTVFALIATGPY